MADASVAVRTPGFESLLRWIAERTGLVFPEHRVGSVRETLERAMSRHGHTDLGSYQAQLDRDSSAFDALVVELTIGETYFFREPGQFAFIAGTILPDLLRQRHGEHALRVWSAACSSGEEAYSLAILFHEEGVGERFRILATDVSQTALARGKAARYRAWSLRGAAASRAEPYLERRGEEYVLADPVRRRVGFEYLNLALDAYPSFANGTWAMDLILCRNVLIYFDGEVIRRVAERLYASLAEGGWLLTAASDPPLEGFAPFEKLVNGDGTFYRRTGEAGAVAEPPARPRANSARP
ncbi:MAG: chemotaxis protein methyltransferase CheR, partial [Candidatus Binatota bacterium]|nr:chemotaxis protein methyltransferase CheR [Candidatus Binatota bacterium]